MAHEARWDSGEAEEMKLDRRSPERNGRGWRVIEAVRGVQEIASLLELIDSRGGYVAGGYASWCVSRRRRPEPPGDIDVWVREPGAFDVVVKALKTAGFEQTLDNEIFLRLKAPEAGVFDVVPVPVQVMKPREEKRFLTFGPALQVVERFDFTVARAFIGRGDNGFVVQGDRDLVADDKARRLRLVYITCPVSAVLRIAKYARKGYKVPITEVFKVLRAWEAQERGAEAEASIDRALEHGASWTAAEWEEWYGQDAVSLVARFD